MSDEETPEQAETPDPEAAESDIENPAAEGRGPDARDPASIEVKAAQPPEDPTTDGNPQGQADAGDESTAQSADLDATSDDLNQDPDPADVAETAETDPHEDPDGPFKLSRRPERRVRRVDFSQPTKFTAEFRRRITRVLSPFCEAVAMRLSAELRCPVELAMAESSQLTWAAAKAQLPVSSLAVSLEVHPIDQQMLLCIELPLILRALESLLGGDPAEASIDRKLSEIDWALARGLLDSIVTQLGLAWRDLGGLELRLGEVDIEGDAGVLAPSGEPTFSLNLDCLVDGHSSTMSLLIPWSAIEPVSEDVLGAGAAPVEPDPREGPAMQRGLSQANVLLRAEIGSVQMRVEEMLALAPGALLALEDRAEDGVALFAEGVGLGRAKPGLRGTRRAIKLTSEMNPSARAPHPRLLHSESESSRPAGTRAAPEGELALAGVSVVADGGLGLDQTGPRELGAEALEEHPSTPEGFARMLGVPVCVWAELGRTTVPLHRALELPPGTVLELDQGADAPIELFVNGLRFAHGSLQVGGDGEWAVQIEQLV